MTKKLESRCLLCGCPPPKGEKLTVWERESGFVVYFCSRCPHIINFRFVAESAALHAERLFHHKKRLQAYLRDWRNLVKRTVAKRKEEAKRGLSAWDPSSEVAPLTTPQDPWVGDGRVFPVKPEDILDP